MKRIPGLDGLRAISIIMVILAHAAPTLPEYVTGHAAFYFLANSHLGVRIFFVISGFLITKLLLREALDSGTINIKQFYLKRAFRIFPVFYLYIFTIVILKVFFTPNIYLEETTPFFAGTYLWNYKQLIYSGLPDARGGWFFGHFWTLAMEEQFYLLWPLFFYKIDKSLLIKIVGIIICVMPIARVLTYIFMPNSRGQIAMMLHTGGDTILIGCLGALMETKPYFNRILKVSQKKLILVFCVIFIFILSPILSSKLGGGYELTIGISLNNICIIVLLFNVIYGHKVGFKFLNNKILVQLGLISYSIYIWQQLFLQSIYTSWFTLFPQNIIVVVLVGYASYYLIEKPILSLRKRIFQSSKLSAP